VARVYILRGVTLFLEEETLIHVEHFVNERLFLS
jgi:hypothetical protein